MRADYAVGGEGIRSLACISRKRKLLFHLMKSNHSVSKSIQCFKVLCNHIAEGMLGPSECLQTSFVLICLYYW